MWLRQERMKSDASSEESKNGCGCAKALMNSATREEMNGWLAMVD